MAPCEGRGRAGSRGLQIVNHLPTYAKEWQILPVPNNHLKGKRAEKKESLDTYMDTKQKIEVNHIR